MRKENDMKKATLLSTAAAVLMTAGAAYAQAPAKDAAPPQPAPAAQQNAPAEKVAPPMKAGQAKPDVRNNDVKKLEPGRGQSAQTNDTRRPDAKADMKGSADPKKADIKTGADANKNAADAKPDGKPDARATTGQGAAGAARLSGEQRTKITSIIRDKKVEPVRLNVSISIGTRIPQDVRYFPLPTEVITIYPQWRGYDYILVGNQILVIDPSSRQIVAILDA
jgi:hypothetical protein